MTGQIRISPDQMRGRAREYNSQADKVDDVIRQMDRLLRALQGEWEGDASKAYEEKFEQLRPGFVAAEDLIREIADSLEATAQSLEDTDAAIAGQFRR